MTTFDIYWMFKLDDILSLLGSVIFFNIVILTLGLFLFGIFYDTLTGEETNRSDREIKRNYRVLQFACKTIIALLLLLLVSVLLKTFLPSTRQAVAMYEIPKLINNEQQVDKVSNLKSAWIEKTIKDLIKNTENKGD